MNRLFTLLFLSFPFLAFSQSYALLNQVVASGGGSGAQGNYDIVWTIGEPVITTVSNQQHMLTQGFHQPNLLASVSTWDLNLTAFNFEVYPNPTTDFLNLTYKLQPENKLSFQVFNAAGRAYGPIESLTSVGTHTLDCINWPAGVYYLMVFDQKSAKAASIKIVRI
ncbi:MAG: T9SS type A sorting domain-containing protein [Saprospiraceae bacterium]|nr:T9SS type A sorting domain-containing protein [Saprospiraceae bacterium]